MHNGRSENCGLVFTFKLNSTVNLTKTIIMYVVNVAVVVVINSRKYVTTKYMNCIKCYMAFITTSDDSSSREKLWEM